jgi:hypothetical protein
VYAEIRWEWLWPIFVFHPEISLGEMKKNHENIRTAMTHYGTEMYTCRTGIRYCYMVAFLFKKILNLQRAEY